MDDEEEEEEEEEAEETNDLNPVLSLYFYCQPIDFST